MLVGAASLIAPIVLIGLGLTGKVEDVATVALMSGVLFALALARIGILMVDVEQHRRIEDQLQASVRAERQRFTENRELLVSLRERQALSDRLFRIQRKISSRAPLQDVLDSITAGASDLLRDEVTGLRLIRSEEHTSELQSLMRISYAVFCLKKKKTQHTYTE